MAGRLEDRIEQLTRELAEVKRQLRAVATPPAPRNIRRGRWPAKLLGDLAAGGTAQAEIYAYNGGSSPEPTGVEVTVREHGGQAMEEDDDVMVDFACDSQWYADRSGGGSGIRMAEVDSSTTFTAGTATASVVRHWGGADPGAEIEIWAEGGELDGVTAWKGVVVFDTVASKWRCLLDRLVAIEDGNAPGVLKNQFSIFNAVAQFESGKDLEMESELTGTAPSKKMRLFGDMNSYPNYNAGAWQSFGKAPTTDALTWLLMVGDNIWIQVTYSGGTVTVEHIGPRGTGEGITVVPAAGSGEGTTTANSEVFDFTASPNGLQDWFVARLTHDETLTPPQPIYVHQRRSSYDSKGHKRDLDGEVRYDLGWKDRLVAIESTNTEGFLWDQFQDQNGAATYVAGKDLLVGVERVGTAPDKNLRLHVDTDQIIAEYSAGEPRFIGKGADDILEMQSIAGDGQWISVAYSSNVWTASHGNPKNETANIVTVGASTPSTSTTANSGTFTANGTNSVELYMQSRTVFDATNLRFVQFIRLMKKDSKGHEYQVGAESGPHTIFDFKTITNYSGTGRHVLTVNGGALEWFPAGLCT